MPITSCFFVDRTTEVERGDDTLRREVITEDIEVFCFSIYPCDCRDRMTISDSIGDLYEDFISAFFFEEFYGDFTSFVGSRAVDLGWVFPTEGTTSERYSWSIVIDSQLTPCETSISGESTDIPITRWIDMELGSGDIHGLQEFFVFEEVMDFFFELVRSNATPRSDDCDELSFVERDLSLSIIWVESMEVLIESSRELVFEGHIGGSFSCCVADHDSLITSTTCIDTLCDFG
jgi:hypothetical protein